MPKAATAATKSYTGAAKLGPAIGLKLTRPSDVANAVNVSNDGIVLVRPNTDKVVLSGTPSGYICHGLTTQWRPIQVTPRSVIVHQGPNTRHQLQQLVTSHPLQLIHGAVQQSHSMAAAAAAGDPAAVPMILRPSRHVPVAAANISCHQTVPSWSVVHVKVQSSATAAAAAKPVLGLAAAAAPGGGGSGTGQAATRAMNVASSAQRFHVMDKNSAAAAVLPTSQWALPMNTLTSGQKVEVRSHLVESTPTWLVSADPGQQLNGG